MKLFKLVFTLLAFQPFGLQAEDKETANPVAKVMAWPDGTRYVGGVLNGKRAGKGTIFWQDGTRFIGQFENDMRNGPGTMVLSDGTTYTAFFKNDKAVDIDLVIAADAKATTERLNNQGQAKADQGTKLLTEIDSPGQPPLTPVSQANENDLDQLVSGPKKTRVAADVSGAVIDRLIQTVDRWAAAWADQDTLLYLANYSEDFTVPGGQSRKSWSTLRKTRITRPSHINLTITYQRFELVDTNVVDVFFQQAYRSNNYSDLVDKVLRLRKEDTDWKILIERSR